MGTIKHVVVVMLENRSFDNVLGWMQSGWPGNYSNPNPNDSTGPAIALQNLQSQTIGGTGTSYPGTMIPLIDPGELFGDMAQQFLGGASVPATDPYTNYGTSDGTMQGFTSNYATQLALAAPDENLTATQLQDNNAGDVMNYLTAEQLPVTAFLAQNFAICDQWYASVPSQTFVNRVFSLCAAPAIVYGSPNFSAINDLDYPVHIVGPAQLTPVATMLELPSICSILDAVLTTEVTWKVYFHDYSIAAMTVPYIANAAQSHGNVNVSTFDTSDWGSEIPTQLSVLPTTFADDVNNQNGGSLPPFSLIEPRYGVGLAPNALPPNSNHPGQTAYGLKSLLDNTSPTDPPIDATGGELLLMQVYNLLQGSSYWDSTLLIITYDEPGGTFDHEPPQPATAPGKINFASPLTVPSARTPTSDDPAANGFTFEVTGGRVPAIIVSPLVASGTVIAPSTGVFDHTSIIATVWELMDLNTALKSMFSPLPAPASLTARDGAAPTLTSALTSSNSAVPFSGTLVVCPSALWFSSNHIDPPAQTILASAGPGVTFTVSWSALAATPPESKNPTMSCTTTAGTADVSMIAVTVAGCFSSQDGTYTGTITIDAGDAGTATIPVTVYVHPVLSAEE